MRAAAAILVILCGCDRLFALDHVDPIDGDVDGQGLACAAHELCDDFDREPPIEGLWDKRVEMGGAALVLSPTDSVSAPNSLLVSVPYPPNLAYLEKDLDSASTSVNVGVALALEPMDATTELDLLAIEWGIAPAPCTGVSFILVTQAQPRTLALQETYTGCGGLRYSTLVADMPGFHTVTVSISVGTPSSITIEIDRTKVLAKDLAVSLPPAPVKFRIGAQYVGGATAPSSLRFDDVTADTE